VFGGEVFLWEGKEGKGQRRGKKIHQSGKVNIGGGEERFSTFGRVSNATCEKKKKGESIRDK